MSKFFVFLFSNILFDVKFLLLVIFCKFLFVFLCRKYRFIICGVEVWRFFYWEIVIFFVDVGCIGVVYSGYF